jgi:hypothetical protein
VIPVTGLRLDEDIAKRETYSDECGGEPRIDAAIEFHVISKRYGVNTAIC